MGVTSHQQYWCPFCRSALIFVDLDTRALVHDEPTCAEYVAATADEVCARLDAELPPKTKKDRGKMMTGKFSVDFMAEATAIIGALDFEKIETLAQHLALAKTIYVCGLGGSAAHASHMANDLRKLCGKNAICPTDNASLMTALANDHDFETWLVEWLELQGPPSDDEAILFLSVGGGNGRTSKSLVMAAQTCKAPAIGLPHIPVLAIVGRDGGEIAKVADCAVIIPNLFPEHVTPHVEGLTSVILHLLVTHPALAKHMPKWST